jgi:hypothetical protein
VAAFEGPSFLRHGALDLAENLGLDPARTQLGRHQGAEAVHGDEDRPRHGDVEGAVRSPEQGRNHEGEGEDREMAHEGDALVHEPLRLAIGALLRGQRRRLLAHGVGARSA